MSHDREDLFMNVVTVPYPPNAYDRLPDVATSSPYAYDDLPVVAKPSPFDLKAYLQRQRVFSWETFGPPDRVSNKDDVGRRSDAVYYGHGCVEHIKKELAEIASCHGKDVEEWIDVIILAFDGALRSGYDPQMIIDALAYKAEKNRNRTWPDWRTTEPGQPIEHIREGDEETRPA